jgi:ankyrin repeat protein
MSEKHYLHEVARDGKREKVNAWINHNPDLVFSRKSDGSTPLHWAATGGHKDAVMLLLANGAEVNARSDNGDTALHNARDHEEVAECLLVHGAEVDAMNNEGKTPFHLADTEVAELLLSHGADINARDHNGSTRLHHAAKYGSKDFVEWLLSNQADVNALDKFGLTPLNRAMGYEGKDVTPASMHELDRSRVEVRDLLRKHGGKSGMELLSEGSLTKPRSVVM